MAVASGYAAALGLSLPRLRLERRGLAQLASTTSPTTLVRCGELTAEAGERPSATEIHSHRAKARLQIQTVEIPARISLCYRGKCDLPRFREADMGLRLGQVLKDIYIPDDVLASLQRAIRADQERSDSWRRHERDRLQKRLSGIRARMDQAYCDKLDGKITEDFWQRKSNEWQQEEQQVLLALNGLQDAEPNRVLTANTILELANKAYFLYVKQNPVEQGKLLKIVLSNCAVDGASLYPAYRKPFDLICKAAKNKEWSALVDDFRTFPFNQLSWAGAWVRAKPSSKRLDKEASFLFLTPNPLPCLGRSA
jgi:hypothetical protein